MKNFNAYLVSCGAGDFILLSPKKWHNMLMPYLEKDMIDVDVYNLSKVSLLDVLRNLSPLHSCGAYKISTTTQLRAFTIENNDFSVLEKFDTWGEFLDLTMPPHVEIKDPIKLWSNNETS